MQHKNRANSTKRPISGQATVCVRGDKGRLSVLPKPAAPLHAGRPVADQTTEWLQEEKADLQREGLPNRKTHPWPRTRHLRSVVQLRKCYRQQGQDPAGCNQARCRLGSKGRTWTASVHADLFRFRKAVMSAMSKSNKPSGQMGKVDPLSWRNCWQNWQETWPLNDLVLGYIRVL